MASSHRAGTRQVSKHWSQTAPVAKVLYSTKYSAFAATNVILFAVAVKLNALDEPQGTADDPGAPVGRQKKQSDQTDNGASQVREAKRQYLFQYITKTKNDNRKVAQ
jgi:hypothetical protein